MRGAVHVRTVVKEVAEILVDVVAVAARIVATLLVEDPLKAILIRALSDSQDLSREEEVFPR
jgi:hypothetical protein